MIKLSVVICTYNRANLLRNCLESLTKQTIAPAKYELIIVDNNSTDQTSRVVDEYKDRLPNLMYYLEEKQGLSNARNRGYMQAKGEYVGYIDDDAKASEDWVERALEIIHNEKPIMFGGPVYPYYQIPKPDWMKDEYNQYSVYDKEGYLGSYEWLSGSNMFILRKELQSIGGFNSALGMHGSTLSYNEETAIQSLLKQRGKKIMYSKSLVAYHLVAKNRYNPVFYLYRNYRIGKDGASIWRRDVKTNPIPDMLRLFDEAMDEIKKALIDSQSTEHDLIEKAAPKFAEIGLQNAAWQNKDASLAEIIKANVTGNMTAQEVDDLVDHLAPEVISELVKSALLHHKLRKRDLMKLLTQ